MSSILDALKKSEAERQRGLPPTLGSPSAFHRRGPAPSRGTRWWLPVVAVIGIAAAWWGGLFDFSGVEPADDATVAGLETPPGAAVAPPVASEGNGPADATAMSATPDSPPAEPAPASAPVAAAPAADAPAASAPAAEPSRRRGFGPFPASGQPAAPIEPTPDVAQAAPVKAPATAPAIAPTTPVVEPAAAPGAATPATTPPATTAAAPDAAVVPTPTTLPATSAPAAPATANDGVPTVYELAFADRRALPEIAVTMHMYSTDPRRRFALVNGVRVRDGESLDGGLEVVRILPDGVQLRFESTEFILPVSN